MSFKILWSQNKHIVVAAVSIFVVSLSTILFFLPGDGDNYLNANVLHASEDTQHSTTEEDTHTVQQDSAKYDKALKNPDAPYFVLDRDGKIAFASEKFVQLTAEKLDVIKGKFIFDFIAKDHREKVFKHYREAFANKQETQQIGPFRIYFGTQENVVFFSFIPLKGELEEILIEVNDVTDDLQKLNDASSDLEAAKENENSRVIAQKVQF